MLLFRQLRVLWNQLSPGQRTGLVGGAAAIVLVAVLTSAWAFRPRYEVLFGDLESSEAGRMVDELRALDQPYRIGGGGRTVLVPRERVYELRLKLASMGMPSHGSVGFEIFDKNTIGMTNFVQRLNYQRALEGELTRTIEQIDEINHARVHLVIPEPSLFVAEEDRPTASVLAHVHEGRVLKERHVQGIRYLVAASVEGLAPDDVTIVDSSGKRLTQETGDASVGLSGRRLDLQQSVEHHLTEKARALLDGVLGPGKSLVQVNADLDFERVERTIETYDDESPVVRSEERSTRSEGAASSGENVVTNYEISRTVERVIGSEANIKRLSVAVLVDGVYVPAAEEGPPEYQPRSEDELTRLRGIVSNAVGIDEDRGDKVTVENLAFDREAFEKDQDAFARQQRMRMILDLANKLGVGLVVVLLVVLARSFFKESRRLLSSPATTEEAAKVVGLAPGELKLLEMQNQLHVMAKEKPERVAQLVRLWLHEERS